MRKFLFLLLLAGCDSQSRDGGGGSPGMSTEEAALMEKLNAGVTPEDAAQLQARAAAALSAVLIDPGSARYASIRSGAAGAICGEVDSKQPNGKHGGMRPFLVTPQGVAVISTTPQVVFADPSDIFPDLYIEYCASPEELTQLGPRLNEAARNPQDIPIPLAELPLDLPKDLPKALPPAEAPPARERSAPAPTPVPVAPRTTSPDDDSFSSAVLRPAPKEQPKP
jgi:hypothetical protein